VAREDVGEARNAYRRRAWSGAHAAFLAADAAAPLDADDLELLAVSTFMLARDEEYVALLERAHRTHLEQGETARAVRCAFWIGLNLLTRGAVGPARGWFGRGERLLADESDCVERGYLVLPEVIQHVIEGDPTAAHDTAAEVAATAARFGDRDLLALAVH